MRNDRIAQIIEELKLLKIAETCLLDELEQTSERSARQQEPAPPLLVGDCIRIINPVRKPKSWINSWDPVAAKSATVTRIDAGKVYFHTDNGLDTWRALKNVRKTR